MKLQTEKKKSKILKNNKEQYNFLLNIRLYFDVHFFLSVMRSVELFYIT